MTKPDTKGTYTCKVNDCVGSHLLSLLQELDHFRPVHITHPASVLHTVFLRLHAAFRLEMELYPWKF